MKRFPFIGLRFMCALLFVGAGLANANSVDITLENDVLKASYGRTKAVKQPKKSKTVQIVKKNARKAIRGIGKQTGSFRPDLKVREARQAEIQAEAIVNAMRAPCAHPALGGSE